MDDTPATPGPEAADDDARVCVGVIVGAHGIQGLVRVKPFTAESEDLDAYGPVTDETGERVFDLQVVGRAKGVMLVAVDGVEDRTGAERMRGTRLYVPREALPELDDEDEFYHSDLIGLRAEFADGTVVGRVAALYDFGAGDVVELRGETGGSAMVPFTRDAVPVIDVAGGRIVVEPIAGLLEGPLEGKPESERRDSAGASKGRPAKAKPPRPAPPPHEEEWPDEDWR